MDKQSKDVLSRSCECGKPVSEHYCYVGTPFEKFRLEAAWCCDGGMDGKGHDADCVHASSSGVVAPPAEPK